MALGTQNGGMSFLMTIGAGAFLLFAVCVIKFMGVGGGVRQDVSLFDWLTILPVVHFALLLTFPRAAVMLFRRMVGAGRAIVCSASGLVSRDFWCLTPTVTEKKLQSPGSSR